MKRPSLSVLKGNVDGSIVEGTFTFANGHEVPLYRIESSNALNQLIGKAKFINESYGNVYYRGVDGLYDNALPKLMRPTSRKTKLSTKLTKLNKVLNSVINDDLLSKSLQLERFIAKHSFSSPSEIGRAKRLQKYCVEALLQHYSGTTTFLDVVDNHWVALWMGLQKFIALGEGKKYTKCETRELNAYDLFEKAGFIYDLLKSGKTIDEDIFIYILLLGMPYPETLLENGIIETEQFVEVDLRRALPSFFLRPHAQHALVIKRREVFIKTETDSDMASQVLAVLKIRIDKANEWLGKGGLLTQKNLFPSPSVDHGYHTLLKREDLFSNTFEIQRYY